MASAFVIRLAATAVLSIALAACSLPRGAALQSEILREKDSAQAPYEVVAVSRNSVGPISRWPQTGWQGGYNWPRASGGPKSSIIRPSDKVSLVIWDSQENSLLTNDAEKVVSMQGLTVSSTGTIFVPYIEEVVVNGQTPDQARSQIQEKLSAILPSAQVQLTFEPGKENSVDLVSGVTRPGTYPMQGRNFTVLGLISQGGGISSSLRNPLVRLIRGGQTFEIPAKTLLSDASRNIVLRGGDMVVVEEDDRFFTALGATGSEEILYFDRENITALEAMSMVGGISDGRADPKGVLVLREYPAKALRYDGTGPTKRQVIFTIDLTSADGLFSARNLRINPHDTVLVTESPLTTANTVFSLIGRLVGINNQLGSL
ncbi:polysaccharide export protein [Pseudooceanicola sp. 216_PA32_1]|uniref:Polysaccharide export protein n=1 Tax=Pseudooceanicola pacificus TaxID=2676438 RepID=A0A844W154_9RHOB|nr:polysaccharide biosynthesis/export family protein [Pseudooceanicola pacificus]MWB76541.1 polysaccharide export protein [Pseudooceanicola pacificus]